jgi:hypothetical protein
MTLGFSEKINGQPNHFIEKILAGLYKKQIITRECVIEYARNSTGFTDYVSEELYFIDTLEIYLPQVIPKYHTIREDKHDLWRPLKKIHPVIGNRTKKRFQFAPEIPCKSVQKIEIRNSEMTIPKGLKLPAVWIDGKLFYDIAGINKDKMQTLAENDGFESIEAFFDYFIQDHYVGKIIHWTDLRY